MAMTRTEQRLADIRDRIDDLEAAPATEAMLSIRYAGLLRLEAVLLDKLHAERSAA